MSKMPLPFDQGLFLMHLQKGKDLFDHDQLEEARQELEAANLLRPNDEKVMNMLGMTYYKLEMLPEAEEMYLVLAASNPDIYALQSNLGLIQLKLNKLSEAHISLNRALELQPGNAKAHFYMGLLYEKRQMWEEALYHFEQARAEKMVTKMQEKIEEQRNQPELVLPYEVLEVMSDSSETEQDLISEGSADGEVTGRMRVQDLGQAMLQIQDEPVVAQTQGTDTSQRELISAPAAVESSTTESSVAESETMQSAESIIEKIREEIQMAPAWEKTDPAFFPEQLTEPESLNNESNLLISSTIEEPFLLSEEIAADISTFLAETRTQESSEADVFYSEPQLPELSIVNRSETVEEPIAPADEEEGIPTPEEVENTIAPEPLAEPDQTFIEPEASVTGEYVEVTEEHVEELSDEITIDAGSVETPAFAAKEETDLNINFAVNESEDDAAIQEGFLQPSYLTPDFEERNLESTQDMAHTAARPIAESFAVSTEEPIVEPIVEPVVEPVVEESNETEAAGSEPSSENEQAETRIDAIPPAAETQEMANPANLDQFSRDRLYIQPLIGSDRFLLIDPHLLEIIISEKLICRTGTISSYTGNLQFRPWDSEKKDAVPLIVVTGNGILFLADRRKEIFLISLNNEVIFVESNHLLVAQSSLKIEPQVIEHQSTGATFSVARVTGRGTLALTCATKPLTVNVHEGLPANIPAQAVIAWSGRLVSEVLDDAELRKIMMSTDQESMFLRFSGSGDVVVEQGGLWGDRRSKRT